MALPVHIESATDKKKARVSEDSALFTATVPTRPSNLTHELLTARREFRDYFKTTASSPDMNVNGAGTPVQFFIPAAPTPTLREIYGCRFILNGDNLDISTADARRFGSATAVNTPLTNGVTFQSEQGLVTTNIFVEPVRILADFLAYEDKVISYPNSISITSDYAAFDVTFDGPVILPGGTRDRLVVTIRDNLTAISFFRVIARGVQNST